MMNRLIPKIFYAKIEESLDLFVDVLGFAVLHRDAEIAAQRFDRLHPTLKTGQARPWGAREFTVLDRTGVGMVLRQR